jgi:hypothetical protein
MAFSITPGSAVPVAVSLRSPQAARTSAIQTTVTTFLFITILLGWVAG